jgi:hypothetical protein
MGSYAAVLPALILLILCSPLLCAFGALALAYLHQSSQPPNWARHLIGVHFWTWLEILATYVLPGVLSGRVGLNELGKLLYMTILIICSTPVNVAGAALTALRRHITHRKFLQECQPPIIILGHYRSGTTFLYELLAKDPEQSWISMYQTWWPHSFSTGLTHWLAQLCLPKRRVMDNVVYDPERVEEHEFAIMNETLASAYLGALYFPTRRMETFERYGMLNGATAAEEEAFLRAMQKAVDVSAIGSGCKRVVLKNPLDTGRVRQILKQFPDAKFIYIHREPLEVLHSTVNLWKTYVRTTALEKYDEAENLPYVLHAYGAMVRAYMRDRELIPKGNLVELAFSDFAANPLGVAEKAYADLGFEPSKFSAARPHFERYLAGVKDYQQNSYPDNAEYKELVKKHWADIAEAQGYRIS